MVVRLIAILIAIFIPSISIGFGGYEVAQSRAMTDLGAVYIDQGNYTEAVTVLTQATKLDKKNGVALLKLGKTYALMQDHKKAATYYASALRIDPRNTELLCEMGRLALDSGDSSTAIGRFSAALSVNPGSVDAQVGLADSYREVGYFEGAAALYIRAFQLNSSANIAARIGRLYAEYVPAKANLWLKKSEQLGLVGSDAWMCVAQGYVVLHAIDRAKNAINQAQKYRKTEGKYGFREAEFSTLSAIIQAEDDGPESTVANLFLKIIQKNPKAFNAQYNLGVFYFRRHRWILAKQTFEALARQFPDSPKPAESLARLYQKLQQYPTAVSYFKQSIQINPNYLPAYMALGAIYENAGYDHRAVTYYQSASERLPLAIEPIRALAILFAKRAEYPSSNVYFDKWEKRTPNDYDLWNQRGIQSIQRGQFLAAKKFFETAIRMGPDVGISYYYLGTIYHHFNQTQVAERQYLKALRLDPSVAQANANLGKLYELRGDWDSAYQAYQGAIRANPTVYFPYYRLGYLYEMNLNPKMAISFYTRALQLNPGCSDAKKRLEILKKVMQNVWQ